MFAPQFTQTQRYKLNEGHRSSIDGTFYIHRVLSYTFCLTLDRVISDGVASLIHRISRSERSAHAGAQTLTPVDPKILHFVVYPPGTLDAVYEEHMWQPASLAATLRILGVSESDVADLSKSGWSYAADRIARERVRRGWPVHRQNVLLEILTSHMDVSFDLLQIEKNLVLTLKRMGVNSAVVESLRTAKNYIYLLADRLALELEGLGHRAECQNAEQMRQQEKIVRLVPAPEPHP